MKKQARYIIVFLLFSVTFGIATKGYAQKDYLNEIDFMQTQGVRKADRLTVISTIVLDRLRMGSQELIILRPKLTSNVDQNELLLPPVVIMGRTRAKVIEREIAFRHNTSISTDCEPLSRLVHRNGTPQSIPYVAQIEYMPWMDSASLSFHELVSGCAECERGSKLITVSTRLLAPMYNPAYRLLYIFPDEEPLKNRADRYVAMLKFRLNSDHLDPDYANNREVLSNIQSKVAAIVKNPDLNVSEIEILGFASPEGRVAHNKALSERRANAIADFISQKFEIPRENMNVQGMGEDWQMVKSVIEHSNLPQKEKILQIIDTTTNPDDRDDALKKLDGGSTFQLLLDIYYPHIRRIEYSQSYQVRSFNIQEARQIIRSHPKHLSLNEMYLVAKSYSPKSKEFKEVLDIAASIYPDEPVAIVNASAINIEGGNYEAAKERLLKIKEDYRSWNNLAVAYVHSGEYEKAKTYFLKAIQAGDPHATRNLEELQKNINNQKIN